MNPLFLAFLLGLGSRLNVRLIGYLPISELAILVTTPFVLSRVTARDALRPTCWLVPLAAFWFVGTVISDLFNQTDLSLSARGLARALVLICCFPFLSWFMATNTVRKLLWFTIGCVPSLVLSAYVFRGGVADYFVRSRGAVEITWENHWCGLPILVSLFVAIKYYKTRPTLAYLVAIGSGLLNIYMGSRSAGAVLICGAGVCFARNVFSLRLTGAKTGHRHLTLSRAVPAAVLLGVVVLCVVQGYKWAAESNLLGERARKKYESQAASRVGLLSGRADVLAGMLAIAESPVFGYGSWPLDKKDFYVRMCELVGAQPEKNYYNSGYPGIPTHSHIIQAWVQSGFLGGVFWIYVLYCLLRSMYRPMLHERELRLWASIVAVSAAWAVMFSPISDRLTTALVVTVLLRESLAASSAIGIPQRNSPSVEPFARRDGLAHVRIGT
jgi:O-antigen ligase